jgi:uncharacterized protein YdhG (YjbR/CyaY superfamily)
MAKTSKKSGPDGFSVEERAAIKQRAAELKRGAGKGAQDVLAKIAEMPQPDREIAERIHAIVAAVAPELSPKLYYGMPGYAKGAKVVCFFRSGQMDKERYSTLGFSQHANLDEGGFWPTSYAVAELNESDEAMISDLVKRAVC